MGVVSNFDMCTMLRCQHNKIFGGRKVVYSKWSDNMEVSLLGAMDGGMDGGFISQYPKRDYIELRE